MNQERTIIGACDYSLASLQNIKKTLLDYGNPNKELNWAIGGLIITLTSYMIRICHERFVESVELGDSTALDDLKFIQKELNDFITRMIENV